MIENHSSASAQIARVPVIVWAGPVFVLVWSTGFIVARYGMPYTDPMTFLTMRFAGVLVVMIPLAWLWKVQWPSGRQMGHIALAGLMMHVGYLGGVWTAIKMGMPAGLSALIVGLQPVLTAVLAARLAEHVSKRQWMGLLLGLTGVAIVLGDKIELDGVTWVSTAFCFMALLAMTSGTLYQKRFCPKFDFRAGSVVQYGASGVVTASLMLLLEPVHVDWNLQVVAALVWSVLPLSIGAMSLWFLLLQRGQATRVSSLMYLTPPTTAIMAWFLLGEALTLWVMLGTAVTVIGVWLVTHGRREQPSR